MKQESFWNICNVRECALNFQNLRADKPNLKKIWIFVEWKKNILWLDTIQCSKCTTRYPCCVLSYFSPVFVMEQLTNPSYKSQLSRAINYKCTQDTGKFCAFCLLEKFHPRKIRAVLCLTMYWFKVPQVTFVVTYPKTHLLLPVGSGTWLLLSTLLSSAIAQLHIFHERKSDQLPRTKKHESRHNLNLIILKVEVWTRRSIWRGDVNRHCWQRKTKGHWEVPLH